MRIVSSLSLSLSNRVAVCLLGFIAGILVASYVLQLSSVNLSPLEETLGDGSDDGRLTVKAFMWRLVTVTAISDSHFRESLGMLSSVETCLPHNKIILYDLGLNDKNKRKIKQQYKTVEIQPFPFGDYKNLSHVRDLRKYAWKPIIMNKVSLDYDIIMYGDASMRMRSCDIRRALAHLLYFPLLAAVGLSYIAIEFTHDGMIEYLQYPKSREDLANMYSIEATGFLLWANAMMKEVLIKPWLDCALHKECIAPAGATIKPCHLTNRHDGHYVGCHRYDQSALDLILAREFGAVSSLRARNETVSKLIWCFWKSESLGRFLC